MPWAKWQVRTRGGQPATGRLGRDWMGARYSLCGDGMKCFQRNWLIVQDAKYLFDQTKLQLKKPESLDFKSTNLARRELAVGKGSGEVLPVRKSWRRCHRSTHSACHLGSGSLGSHHSRTGPGAASFPDVLKGFPKRHGFSHIEWPFALLLKWTHRSEIKYCQCLLAFTFIVSGWPVRFSSAAS